MSDWLQLAIGVGIVCLVLFAVHRHGRGNPASTGSLDRKIGKLFSLVRDLETNIRDTATTGDIELIRSEMKRVEGAAASAGMVAALEGKLNRMEERLKGQTETLEAKIDGVAQAAERTEQMVQRIDGILMRKAFEQ